MEKNKLPKDMPTALDCAIRDSEGKMGGYKVKKSGTSYYNYMSNEEWIGYLGEMDETHKKQYKDGGGGELYPGKYPPKMASFGSSSRFIYELSKDKREFEFEEKLDTKVGGVANLDGFIKTKDKYIYVEAKRREIYGASHVNEKIKVVYQDVYNNIKKHVANFSYEMLGKEDEEGNKNCTFKIEGKEVKYFDLKQLICHFLGITYDIAKHSVKNAKVKFLYLLYNPKDVKNYIDERYHKRVLDRYDEVKDFIDKNIDIFKSIFDTILEYQINSHRLPEIKIDFEFKRVDQNEYKSEFNFNKP